MAIIGFILDLYLFVLLARVVLSWVYVGRGNPVVEFIYSITEPVLEPVRRVIPPIGGGLDISPVIVMLLIYVIRNIFRI